MNGAKSRPTPADSSSGRRDCWSRWASSSCILQGVSELIKRLAFLQGLIPDPTEKVLSKSAEEELAEAIRQARGEQA